MMWRGRLWQYPAKAQPVQEVALPTLDWLVQQPDPVRRPPELIGEQFAFTRLVELSEIPIDWVPQYPDPVRRPPELVHEQIAFLRLVGLSEITIDWLLQQPDPVLLPERLVPGATTLVEEFAAPPPVSDIGWLVQHPVAPPLLLPQQPDSFVFGPEPIIPSYDWFSQEQEQVWVVAVPLQPDPLVFPGEPIIPAFDWWTQEPELVWAVAVPQQPESLTFQPEPIIPAFDWFVQASDVIRRVPPVLEGASILVEFGIPIPPAIPDIDFIVQHPVPPLPLPLPQQPDSFAFGPVPIIPAFDWFVQETDVIRRVPPVLEGASVLVEFGVPVVIDVDWLVQHPDPLPKPPPTQTEPELAFEHEDLIPAPDWLVQHPEPVQPLDYPVSGEQPLVEEYLPPLLADIDWLVQHPRPVLPPERLVPEAFAFEFEHELLIPSIDWLQQLPDPIQELRRPPTEPVAPELVEVPPPPVVFDWLVQHPDPVLPEKPRQDWYVRVDEMVEIPIETWLQPPSQPVRLPIQLVRFHGELFLIEFAVPPGVGIPFVFRECQALWEIVHPQFWESAVASSGYIPPPEYVPIPSGYIAEEDGTAPWDMVR